MIHRQSSNSNIIPTDTCGQPCEIWSRPCGYYRPTRNWNLGKKSEFEDRVTFAVNDKPCSSCKEKKNG